jgi:hypothetical protein
VSNNRDDGQFYAAPYFLKPLLKKSEMYRDLPSGILLGISGVVVSASAPVWGAIQGSRRQALPVLVNTKNEEYTK